jgi:hypothetical protein
MTPLESVTSRGHPYAESKRALERTTSGWRRRRLRLRFRERESAALTGVLLAMNVACQRDPASGDCSCEARRESVAATAVAAVAVWPAGHVGGDVRVSARAYRPRGCLDLLRPRRGGRCVLRHGEAPEAARRLKSTLPGASSTSLKAAYARRSCHRGLAPASSGTVLQSQNSAVPLRRAERRPLGRRPSG